MIFNRKYLFGISALIFLLTAALPDVSLSRESQPGEQNILRQASLEWMQVGFKQYQSKQFANAERSFRRALVFQKYLTEVERLKINKFLTKTRIDLSEGKQPAAAALPAKAEEKVKDSEPSPVKEQQQAIKKPKTINSRIEQKVQPVKTAEPDVPKMQIAADSPGDVIVVKNKSFRSELMRLSDWLSENRRNVLLIGLPVLAVLVIISKLQKMRIRPGRSIYTNRVPASVSYIGSRLNGGNGNARSASAAANPKRKRFEQSMEHWRKNAIKSPAESKPSRPSEKWPQRKDKRDAGESLIDKAGRKLCRKCEQTKPHSDFHKDKSTKDGLARWCKDCKKQYRKKRAAEKK